MKQPVVLSSSLRPAGPRKRSVDSSLILSLNSKYLASGYRAPRAVLIRTDAMVTKTDKVPALTQLSPSKPWTFLEC